MRPASLTSNGSISTLPPAAVTFAAVSSALSTQTYVFHIAIGGAPSGIDPIAAASLPCNRPMMYSPSAHSGIMFSNSHPNKPR
jgi:hypothetical protein